MMRVRDDYRKTLLYACRRLRKAFRALGYAMLGAMRLR